MNEANVDLYAPTDFYPKEIADAKIGEIDNWIKSTEPRKLDRVPIEADQLDSDAISKIEVAVDQLPSNAADPYKPRRVNGVPRLALLHPSHAEGRLSGQAFAVGDRVVYVLNSGKVDIAMRGTVVGINTSTLDILFDSTIMSGSTLGGRCAEGRGGVVPKSSVLNITNPTVVAYSKAGLQRKPEEDNSRTASPAHATRSQFNRPGRGRGGGNWYTPWAVNAPAPVKQHSGPPKTTAPFNPTVLLRQSQQGGSMQVPAGTATTHLYRNGVGIPPPANLDQRQRVRGPQQQQAMGMPPFSMQSPPRGGAPTGPRGGRGGRGGIRGGAMNGSPRGGAVNYSPGRGAYRGRGRGSGVNPTPAQTQPSQ
jgi:Xrn1 SH3-like domain/Exoribonuclease 1 Domain-3